MNNEKLLERITVNPNICHGKPTVRGLRYPVQNILELLASNMTRQEILADFEDLEEEDLQACLLFAARNSSFIPQPKKNNHQQQTNFQNPIML